MLCDRSLSVARGCARVYYRIVTVKTCSNGPIDVDRRGCVQFVGEEKRFCTAWVTIGKEVYYLSADGTIMPIKKNQAPPDLKYFNQKK